MSRKSPFRLMPTLPVVLLVQALAPSERGWSEQLEDGIRRTVESHRTYRGDASTKVYHTSSCPLLAETDDAHLVAFRSAAVAREEGYAPCRECMAAQPTGSGGSSTGAGGTARRIAGAVLLLAVLAGGGVALARRTGGTTAPDQAEPAHGVLVSFHYPLGEVDAALADSDRRLEARVELSVSTAAATPEEDADAAPREETSLRQQLEREARAELGENRERMVTAITDELAVSSFQHFLSPKLKRDMMERVRAAADSVVERSEVEHVHFAEAQLSSSPSSGNTDETTVDVSTAPSLEVSHEPIH